MAGAKVYFIWADEVERVKIGFSANPGARLKELQTATPFELRLGLVAPGTRETEARLHRRFRQHHVRGEWFRGHYDIQWTEFATGPSVTAGHSLDKLLDVTKPWTGAPAPTDEMLRAAGSPEGFVLLWRSIEALFSKGGA